jgi:ribokinase
MRILNFGSLNIDYVYRVEHIARPGETLSSTSYAMFAGGKGANQSAALAKAGADVWHAGKIGKEGQWIVEKLASLAVNTDFVSVAAEPSGHAMIQVDDSGQNAIILFPGCNKTFTKSYIDGVLDAFAPGTILLLQNETNEVPYLIEAGSRRGMKICFNPAPFDNTVRNYPLAKVNILILNEIEAMELTCSNAIHAALAKLEALLPDSEILITLGAEGAVHSYDGKHTRIPAFPVEVVDTTAAGDTFIGYFIAAKVRNESIEQCLKWACKAASLCVSRQGAMDSIPINTEVF